MGSQDVFGVSLSSQTIEELLEEIASHRPPKGSGPRMVFSMNLDHVVKLRGNENFRRAYRAADIVTADGMPVLLYGRLRGADISRITGADLFARLMPRLKPDRQRCFFVASTDELGRAMIEHLVKRGLPRGQLAFYAPPLGFEKNEAVCEALARLIGEFAPTHLFFCVGAPKSEIWCHRYADQIGDAYVLCVGAAIEFYLGRKRRAPRFMQHAGLEWFWRWGQEPRRLTQRYFVSSWGFAGAVRDDLWRQRRQSEAKR